MEETLNFGPALALFGAAIASSLGGVGSSIGVGLAGASGAGVTTEKPELFGKVLLLQALPGSQAIYGLVGFFLVFFFVGMENIKDTYTGLAILAACIPLGVTGLFSGMFQGKVSAAGMNILANNPGDLGKAIILSAIVETFAIFGFLVTFLALNAIKGAI
jgi:V/A-type H+/Na+-transporting ATPase subunit K